MVITALIRNMLFINANEVKKTQNRRLISKWFKFDFLKKYINEKRRNISAGENDVPNIL
jgi:hypothetical protein